MGQQRDSYCQKCVRSDNIKIMPEAAKKSPAKKAAKPKAAPAHPPTATMVMAAVKGLKEAKGASLPAIKKYIAGNYKVDIVKLSPFVRKALKSLVEKKKLVQTKGTGASGRFKANKEEKPKKVAKPKAKKVTKKAAKKPAGERKQKLPKRRLLLNPKRPPLPRSPRLPKRPKRQRSLPPKSPQRRLPHLKRRLHPKRSKCKRSFI